MKIQKQELLNALEIVKPGLANKEILEQSTSFAFIDGCIVTYNDEISISHPLTDVDITGAVEAEALYKFLSKITTETVSIDKTEKEIRIKAGKGRAGLPLAQEIRMPLEGVQTKGKWKKLPDEFSQALTMCAVSCSKDMSRPVLTAVHGRKDGKLEGSDGFKLTQYSLSELPIPFLLPASAALVLAGYEPNKVSEGSGWLHFKNEQGTIFSSRVFEDEYPPTDHLLEIKGVKIKLPEELGEVTDRASVFARRENRLDESIYIKINENKLIVSAEGESGSWFKESIKMEYGKDSLLSFMINPTFLMSAADKTPACTVGEHQLKFRGKNWEHVVALQQEEQDPI